jgi:hypothetical protein
MITVLKSNPYRIEVIFGGHPPGVGAAHQPRAEERIPYGESVGRAQFWKLAGRLWEAPL